MAAVNYKGEESEQSKARRAKKGKKKPPKKPKPWYLGWGLAKIGGSNLKKSREEHDAKMAKIKRDKGD